MALRGDRLSERDRKFFRFELLLGLAGDRLLDADLGGLSLTGDILLERDLLTGLLLEICLSFFDLFLDGDWLRDLESLLETLL